MANETKKIETWEREKQMMLPNLNGRDPSDRVSEDEFNAMLIDKDGQVTATSVDVEGRSEWLEANDYEVTRENLMNPDLLSKAAKQEQSENAGQ